MTSASKQEPCATRRGLGAATHLSLLMLALLPGCARGETRPAGILCPSTVATLRQAICDDADLRVLDQEMGRLVESYRRVPAARAALDAPPGSTGEPAVAPAWPQPATPAGGDGRPAGSAEDLAASLADLQQSWRAAEGVAACFRPGEEAQRRDCLLAQYLETIHRLRRLDRSLIGGDGSGVSWGPLQLDCDGIASPLLMSRIDAADRWLFLEWNGDPREPYISWPVLLREAAGQRRGDGWNSLYSNALPAGDAFGLGKIRQVQLQGREAATLSEQLPEAGGGQPTLRRCRLIPDAPGVTSAS